MAASGVTVRTPCSHRLTVVTVTLRAAASWRCVQPSRRRSSRTSIGVMRRSIPSAGVRRHPGAEVAPPEVEATPGRPGLGGELAAVHPRVQGVERDAEELCRFLRCQDTVVVVGRGDHHGCGRRHGPCRGDDIVAEGAEGKQRDARELPRERGEVLDRQRGDLGGESGWHRLPRAPLTAASLSHSPPVVSAYTTCGRACTVPTPAPHHTGNRPAPFWEKI